MSSYLLAAASTRTHRKPFIMRLRAPLSLSFTVCVCVCLTLPASNLSVISLATSPVSRSRGLESLGGTGVEGPRSGSRCSTVPVASLHYTVKSDETRHLIPPRNVLSDRLQLGQPEPRSSERGKRYISRARPRYENVAPRKSISAYSGTLTMRDRRCAPRAVRNAPA